MDHSFYRLLENLSLPLFRKNRTVFNRFDICSASSFGEVLKNSTGGGKSHFPKDCQMDCHRCFVKTEIPISAAMILNPLESVHLREALHGRQFHDKRS